MARALCILFAACAVACGGAATHKPTAAVPEQAPPASSVSSVATGESLLDLVPETALAALVIRSEALALPMQLIQGSPEQRAELGAYLRARLGADVSRTRGLVAYATRVGADSDWVVLLRMDGARELLGESAGQYRNHEIRKLGEGPLLMYGTTLEQGVVVGTRQGVAAAIDLATGAIAPLHARAPLAVLLEVAKPNVSFAAATALDALPVSEASAYVVQFGLQRASFTIDSQQQLGLRVTGNDRARLEQLAVLIELGERQALAVARAAADAARDKPDVWEGAAAIIGYHQLKRALDELGPRLEGNALVASYKAPIQGGGMLPLVGMSAALAVPAFIGYVRRSKTTEVSATFDRLFTLLAAKHAAALEAASKDKAKRKKLLAALAKLRIERTPITVPCATKSTWTEQELARMSSLGFVPDGPTYYSYELGALAAIGKQSDYDPGVVLVLQATGDLDCDQKQSTFELAISVDADGKLVRAPSIYIANEIE